VPKAPRPGSSCHTPCSARGGAVEARPGGKDDVEVDATCLDVQADIGDLPGRAGGAGFLGSNLYARLFADGRDAMCIDNFFPRTKDNIAHLLDNPCFEDRCADGSGVVRAT